MAATHRLDAAPETTRYGLFDATFPPLLTIESGDTVVLGCVAAGAADTLPSGTSGLAVPPALRAIHAAAPERATGHILTGPVAVRGAVPGDTLEVRIEAVEPAADWGYCGHRPLVGTLPHDFPVRALSHIPIDRARRVCRLPWGEGLASRELPLAPFFGVMGVAPPAAWGAIGTREPRAHGGNLDCRELVAGTTLFLPVWAEGALFSAGDGHGLQGDGEVCINGLETCLDGTFTLVRHPDQGLRFPRAETPTHFISMGLDEDLDQALRQALREMIAFLVARAGLSPGEAYQLCSLAVDFRVTQSVNGVRGVHGLCPRSLLRG